MQNQRIESELEVKAYLQNLKYAIEHGAHVSFQRLRRVDDKREARFTNDFTVNALFPNEDIVEVLKRELSKFICGRVYTNDKRYSFSKKK